MSDTPISDAYWTGKNLDPANWMPEGAFTRELERTITRTKRELNAHKEALEKCRSALLGYLDVLPSRELHEALTAIAKCKEQNK